MGDKGPAGGAGVPGVADVERITGVANPIVRNLQITQCYSRLAAAIAKDTGPGANWCTFATWASRQAGSTIRGEDGLRFVQDRLNAGAELLHPIRSFWRWLLRRGLLRRGSRLERCIDVLHTPFEALEMAGDAVARGNKKVFEEIGLEFARYLRECPAGAPLDSPEVEGFLDGLRPGDPPEGQRHLRDAFVLYQRVRLGEDPVVQAQLLLLANLQIGLHEQTRLQPEIAEALNAPYETGEDVGRRLLEALFPQGTRTRRVVPDRVAAPALGAVGKRVERVSAEIAREVLTETLMVLSLPGRVLALGKHLPDVYPGALAEISDEALAGLLAQYEPVPPAPDDCGARDWAVLHQRMHYIIHLFRSFHATADLFDAPFTQAQVEAFTAGAIPDGNL